MRFVFGIAVLLASFTAHSAPAYRITVLPFGSDINNSGDVAGTQLNADGNTYSAMLYRGGQIYNLGAATRYGVGGINNLGEITRLDAYGNDWQRISYDGSQSTVLETYLGSSVLTNLKDVNDVGQAVGTRSSQLDPYLLSDGTVTNLGSIPGMGGDSRAHGINNSPGRVFRFYRPYACGSHQGDLNGKSCLVRIKIPAKIYDGTPHRPWHRMRRHRPPGSRRLRRRCRRAR